MLEWNGWGSDVLHDAMIRIMMHTYHDVMARERTYMREQEDFSRVLG